MHANIFSTLITALAALISGCAGESIRKPVADMPEFSGVFFADGHAAAGAKVLIGFSGDHDHPCNGLPTVATVDASGHFLAPAKTSKMSAEDLEAAQSHLFQTYICFSYNGKVLVDSMFITQPNDPYRYIGICKIPYTTGYDEGLCQWRKEHA